MDQVYGSRDHDWLSVHGGLATMRQRDCSETREVVVIAQREMRSSGFSPWGGATCMQSCGDGYMTTLNRGGWSCSDGEMVPDAMRRDCSQGGCVDNVGALIVPFIRP
jgi:hypothetical protein